jgi:hypothetical protein
VLYNVASSDTRTTFTSDIGRFGQNDLITGVYSVVLQAYNGYLFSIESLPVSVTIRPTTTKASIVSIIGSYSAQGLEYAEITFSINTFWVETNKISTIKVAGLNSEYSTKLNIFNQEIAGTGEHKIRVPATVSGREIIVVGTAYTVTITLVFSVTNEEQTSEPFSYTPEIRYG